MIPNVRLGQFVNPEAARIPEVVYAFALSIFDVFCPYVVFIGDSFPSQLLKDSLSYANHPFLCVSILAGLMVLPSIAIPRARCRRYLLFSLFLNLAILVNFGSQTLYVVYQMIYLRPFPVSACIFEMLFRFFLLTTHSYLITLSTVYYEILYYELDTANSELYLALLHHLGPRVDDEIGFGMNVDENFEILRRRQRRRRAN